MYHIHLLGHHNHSLLLPEGLQLFFQSWSHQNTARKNQQKITMMMMFKFFPNLNKRTCSYHIIILKSASFFEKPCNSKSKVLNRSKRNWIAKCKEPTTLDMMILNTLSDESRARNLFDVNTQLNKPN
jgi:hypothetical protein